ncbi:MAG: cupin domain-containing protein [Cyclobacteriaceae bacterium]
MITANLNKIELNEFIGLDNPEQHCKATFPLIGVHGATDLATVYFEIEPADHLGRHTDSAEELLIILEGEVEVEIDGEKEVVSAGNIALVPEMVPHNITNLGSRKAKVLGVFGGKNNIVATFEKEWLPTYSNVVDTSQLT